MYSNIINTSSAIKPQTISIHNLPLRGLHDSPFQSRRKVDAGTVAPLTAFWLKMLL